jgi:hypothetical protein
MSISILFYDKNESDCKWFKSEQQKLQARKVAGRPRMIYTAHSLDRIEAMNGGFDICFFDVYHGSTYDPDAIKAAQHIHNKKSNPQSMRPQMHFLVKTYESVHQDLKFFLRENVGRYGLIAKNSRINKPTTIINDIIDHVENR